MKNEKGKRKKEERQWRMNSASMGGRIILATEPSIAGHVYTDGHGFFLNKNRLIPSVYQTNAR